MIFKVSSREPEGLFRRFDVCRLEIEIDVKLCVQDLNVDAVNKNYVEPSLLEIN